MKKRRGAASMFARNTAITMGIMHDLSKINADARHRVVESMTHIPLLLYGVQTRIL